jgi:hypothetical protein
MKDSPLERWKQSICDAIMRRIKCRQGITVAEIIDEIGAPNEHHEELVCMIHSLISVLQRRGVAFMLPNPAEHPNSNGMRLNKPSRKYGKRLPKPAPHDSDADLAVSALRVRTLRGRPGAAGQ